MTADNSADGLRANPELEMQHALEFVDLYLASGIAIPERFGSREDFARVLVKGANMGMALPADVALNILLGPPPVEL